MLCVSRITGEMFGNILESGERERGWPLFFFTATCKENCTQSQEGVLKGEPEGGGVRVDTWKLLGI